MNGRRIRGRTEMIGAVEDYLKDIKGVNEPDRNISSTTIGRKK